MIRFLFVFLALCGIASAAEPALQVELNMLAKTNAARSRHGLPPLVMDAEPVTNPTPIVLAPSPALIASDPVTLLKVMLSGPAPPVIVISSLEEAHLGPGAEEEVVDASQLQC